MALLDTSTMQAALHGGALVRPTPVPLGQQAYKRSGGFVPEVELLNMYVEKDETGISQDGVMRIQRPGLRRFQTLPARISGFFRQDGVLSGAYFAIAGGKLYSFTSSGYTELGAVGFGRAEFAATFLGLYIAVDGNLFYTDGATITAIAMPDGRGAMSIDTLDSYILVFCADGRFYWIVPGETTIDALNFATAESSPDGGKAVRRLVDEAWFFGAETVEPWQTTGDSAAPFHRASGRVYDRGCLSRDTVLRFDNGILWVGEDGIVYRTSNVPQAISTAGIEERIRLASGPLSAFKYDSNGHKSYVLKIPGQGDFGYDARTQEWERYASPNAASWLPAFGDRTICCSGTDGAIWTLDADYPTDDGVAFRKLVSGTIPVRGKPVRNSSLSVNVGSTSGATFRLRWRDADEDFPDYWDEFETTAGADVFTHFRLGQARQPYRTFEIDNIEATQVRISDAMFNGGYN